MDTVRAKHMADELLNSNVGGWTITDFLAPGKSALVFGARRGVEVAALKIFDPELVERFGREIQERRIDRELSLRGTHHANLVRILDGGCCPDSGYLFVVMELIDGPALSSVIKDLPRDHIRPIISQIAGAARFLEGMELVHRDIKPENIAITADFRHATLLDLGVIRPLGNSDLTDEDQLTFVGTLQYSSPEFLIRREEHSLEGWRALTFYQLGAVLHDMIMGERLFYQFVDPFARLVHAVEHEVPKIDAPDVSPELVLLANNCLVKDPELRLHLVGWGEFEERAGSPSPSLEARERIRKRLVEARHVNGRAATQINEQKDRTTRRMLNEIQSELQSFIRAECVGADLFPPMEVHERQDVRGDRTHFHLKLGPSIDHSLGAPLYIWFSIHLVDQLSRVIKVFCRAAVSPSLVAGEIAADNGGGVIFDGVFEGPVLKSILRPMLYELLDSAQVELGRTPGGDETSWLILTGLKQYEER